MITFLPYANYFETAACLDRQRLGKQRSETLLIARCLAGEPSSWKNHPAVKMWRQYGPELVRYQEAIVYEWHEVRGYADTCLAQTTELLAEFEDEGTPWWLGDEKFHLSHQGNLLRKNKEHYGRFFPDADPELAYVWPTEDIGLWR